MNVSRALSKLEYAPLLYCKSSVYICATLFVYITFFFGNMVISRFRLRSVRVTSRVTTLDQSIGDSARFSHEITVLPLPPRARMGLG
jgi:hypothetical protein